MGADPGRRRLPTPGTPLAHHARRAGPVRSAVSFTGFPDEGLVFYEGLEADNSKTYWTEHRHLYEECVRTPMQALADELAPEFGSPKLFRPYRDVRFSHDKTPYKTHQGAVLHHEGREIGRAHV